MRRLSLLLIVALAGCGEKDAAPTEKLPPERALAARQACVAEQLEQGAEEDLKTLQTSVGGIGVTQFAQAFLQHARLRVAGFSQADSALNHSPTPRDSARHMAAANRYEIITPDPGSLEANVLASYEQKANAILADSDHVCNWRHELKD
jgi:hypothetical protein